MLLVAAAVLALSVDPPRTAPPAPWPAPGSSWCRLRLEARKAIFKGSADIRVARVPAADVVTELRQWPEGGARIPVGEVAVFRLESKATMRGEALRTTWLDAAGLLQDDGREGRRGTLRRFGASGLHAWKARGSGIVEERFVALEDPGPRAIVDVAGLLWLATGLRMDREGATMKVAVVSHGAVVPLDLSAKGTETIQSRGGAVVARRVLIRPTDPEAEASLFGLRGDVDLLLETSSGMPVELRGRVAKLGAVRVRVVEVVPEAAP